MRRNSQQLASLVFCLFIAVSCTGKRAAIPGDTFFDNLEKEPTTLNPISAEDAYTMDVADKVFDGLLTINPDTFEREPALAERWEVSKDGLTFTFYLRKDIFFHDGKPVTMDDVKFSFDVVRDDRYKAAAKRPYIENISGYEVVDDHTIRFKAKKKIFNNLAAISSNSIMPILPKHFYEDPNRKYDTMVGTGPYRFVEYNRGKNILLERNDKWYGFKTEMQKNYYRIPKMFYRFAADENLRMEMLKKGELDSVYPLTPEAFQLKAVGDPWGKTVIKEKVENLYPVRTGFIAWNLKNPLFADKRVRLALAHLMNRDLMNEKFRFGMSLLAAGPWYQQNPFADPTVKPIPFDPGKAAELLKQAGFSDSNKNGVLEKTLDGKVRELRFTLIFANRDVEKYFTLYQEDLKKAGIAMDLKLVEFNTMIKAIDERKFDAVSLAWSGVVEYDPKQIWHSESMRSGGSNFIGYSNKQVDKEIDQGREELDMEKRKKIFGHVYRMIAEDAPYAFLFNERYQLYAHSARMKMDQPTRKYSIGQELWQIQ